jgi:hypothetical protein
MPGIGGRLDALGGDRNGLRVEKTRNTIAARTGRTCTEKCLGKREGQPARKTLRSPNCTGNNRQETMGEKYLSGV